MSAQQEKSEQELVAIADRMLQQLEEDYMEVHSHNQSALEGQEDEAKPVDEPQQEELNGYVALGGDYEPMEISSESEGSEEGGE